LWMILLALASGALVIYQEFQVDGAEYIEIEYLIMMAGAWFLFVPTLYAQKKLEIKKRMSNRRAKRRLSNKNRG